ncbi:hypothetical protein ELUMI_v1c01030 [Williamsoniiplasma luminosum]|uniref:Uncharacterized protein n=1 Tax=Williamsoniiplasma luminosum TaxID=214888 RepID=A0A2K8NVQ9_9MOLU|nr:MG406 family protein [Williamsoniiplasma luminosum]ATZ16831.1 hypothetical protein ELUMI_v1c01030 [Williamsoniiplasma luminosum]AVP49503.1 MAG: hypothetical protein C5T88_02915 [Williamsoniiplasma luminosum]
MKSAIHKIKNIKINNKWKVISYTSLVALIAILTLVLGILVGFKTISWNWMTGLVLGFIFSLLGIYVVIFATKTLVKNENYFLYYFFYVLRVGIYATPLIMGFLIPNLIFNWIGILLGLTPVLLIPLFKNEIL